MQRYESAEARAPGDGLVEEGAAQVLCARALWMSALVSSLSALVINLIPEWSALTEGGQHAPMALSGWAAGSDLGSSLAVVGLVATVQGGLQARRAVLRVVEPRSRLCTTICCCGCARARSELPWWALEVRGSWGFSPALAAGRAAPLDCCRALPRPWLRGLLVFPLGALLGALVVVALHGAGCTPVPGHVWVLAKPLACAGFAAACFVLSWVGELAVQGREPGESRQALLAA